LHTILALAGTVLGAIIIPIGFKSCAKDMLIESQAPLWSALQDVKSFQDASALKLLSKDDLVKVIQELAQTQAGLELKLKTLESVEAERGRLEQELKMPPFPGYETHVARILNRDLNGWWQQLWIDAGRAQGVRAGLGVVSRFGVVGRVREVYDQVSVVELVTSPHYRMAAQMKGDERPFVYQGMGLRFAMSPAGIVQALQPEMALKRGESKPIVTTGLSGSFPEGLPIGELIETGSVSEGGLLEGKVKLPQNLQNLKEVSLLIPYR
jgi:rod shape-determining protein MreC